MGKLVLIDGHSILNRAFYGVPELTNSIWRRFVRPLMQPKF